jgi:hypothetical protein
MTHTPAPNAADNWNVRLAASGDMESLLVDHLVSATKQGLRYSGAERCRSNWGLQFNA